MSTPSWQSVVPPPPPFPPGDPRLGPWQPSYPAVSWPAQPPWHPGAQLLPPAAQRPNRLVLALIATLGIFVLGVTYWMANVAPAQVTYTGSAGQPAVGTPQEPKDTRPVAAAPTQGLDFGPSPALSVVVPQIEAFVEEARGHHFAKSVTVTPLGDKAFLAKLHEGSKGGATRAASIAAEDATLEALHLVPRHTDLAATMSAAYDQGVGGFYDPVTQQLYVRGTQLNPLAQVIVAHELTHALDDQWFHLRRLEGQPRNGDEMLALRSLFEGDARSVEDRFRAALVPAEAKRAAAEEKAQYGGAGADKTPVFLELTSGFPYEVGEHFVETLRAEGGTGAVDSAFRAPPTSTQQIMSPQETYLARSVPMPFGTSGGVKGLLEQDSVGAFGLAAILSDNNPKTLLHQPAVAEWNGDHYLTVRSGSQICVTDTISTRGGPGAGTLFAALRTWAAKHPGASVTRRSDTMLRLVSCLD